MTICPRWTAYPLTRPSSSTGLPVVSVARLTLMKPPPSTTMPAGLAMIVSARAPATSIYPCRWLGIFELTSFRMTRAVPVPSHGLPCTQPPSWLCTLVRELFRMAPLFGTSNCEYTLRDTPAPLGVLMFTCRTPLAALSTVARCCPGACGSATICAMPEPVRPIPPSPRPTSRASRRNAGRCITFDTASPAGPTPGPFDRLRAVSCTTMHMPRVLLNTIR